MARGTRSTRRSSRSPNRWGDLIDPLRENGYDPLFAQQRALLAAIDVVPTPNSPAGSRRLGDRYSITSEDLDAAVAAAGLFTSPTSPALHSGYQDRNGLGPYSDNGSASVPRRSRSATPSQRRAPVGPTPTLPAQSPLFSGSGFGVPSPPRARSVSAVAGGEPSPRYIPYFDEYNPFGGFGNGNSPRSPVGGAVARRLDGLANTLEHLRRHVDLRTDRIEAQLTVVIDALSSQRNGAAAAAIPNGRKRKRSADGREVVDLTGATPSPKSPKKKVDFVDLVSKSSSSSSALFPYGSDDDDDDEDDDGKTSTPLKKSKTSPQRSPSSLRSPRTPPNNRTPSPPRTPRKAPPRRPPPKDTTPPACSKHALDTTSSSQNQSSFKKSSCSSTTHATSADRSSHATCATCSSQECASPEAKASRGPNTRAIAGDNERPGRSEEGCSQTSFSHYKIRPPETYLSLGRYRPLDLVVAERLGHLGVDSDHVGRKSFVLLDLGVAATF